MARTDRAAALRPFAEFLSGLNKGRICDELTVHLAEVTEAVSKLGKPGKVTLTINVRPRKNDEGTVDVLATASGSPPKPEHGGAFFFDDSYQLSRDDPAYAEPLISYDDASSKGVK